MANVFGVLFFVLVLVSVSGAKNISCAKNDSLIDVKVHNCRLIPSEEKEFKLLENLAKDDDVKLLKILLDFPEATIQNLLKKQFQSLKNISKHSGYFYAPFEWYITTSNLGERLINLQPNYAVLSLTTLKIKTESVPIFLIDQPRGCLRWLSFHQYLFLVKEWLQDTVKNRKGKNEEFGLSDKVCTSILLDDAGSSEFSPICYETSRNGTCLYLKTDTWSVTLQWFMRFIKILAILFCPLLIPKKLYQLKYLEESFVLKIQQKISLKIIVSTKNTSLKNTHKLVSIPIVHFDQCKNFKPRDLKHNVEYKLDVDNLHLGIEEDRLVSASYVPTGLGSVIFRNLYHCQIRDSDAFSACCHSSLIPQKLRSKCCGSSEQLRWFQCCESFMKLLLFLLLALPWTLRLLIYYFYEKEAFQTRKAAADARGLGLTYEGFFLGFLTPLHWLFASMYIIYGIDLLVLGIFVQRVARKLRIMIKQCIRDMYLGWSFRVLHWCVRLFLGPFTLCGVFGCFLAPVYWVFATPLIFLIFCFYYIPLVNLLFRFLLHMLWFCLPKFIIEMKLDCLNHISHQMEQLRRQINLEKLYPDRKIVSSDIRGQTCCHRLFQIFIVILCLFNLAAMALLLTECLGYAIEMLSFTLIGMILHSELVLPFFSLGFLIIVYFLRSIRKVRLTYLNFNDLIINEIIKASGFYEPRNCANSVRFVSDGFIDGMRFYKHKGIFCKAFSMLLFLDANERPLIPSEFFFKACEMPVPVLPGSLSKNYLKAFLKFFLILLFLIFVTIVVLTFGEMYNVSSTNQVLATLGGGFLPWFIEHIIEIQSDKKEVNTETLNFRNHFRKAVKEFSQTWQILDIVGEPKEVTKTTEKKKTAAAGTTAEYGAADDNAAKKSAAAEYGAADDTAAKKSAPAEYGADDDTAARDTAAVDTAAEYSAADDTADAEYSVIDDTAVRDVADDVDYGGYTKLEILDDLQPTHQNLYVHILELNITASDINT